MFDISTCDSNLKEVFFLLSMFKSFWISIGLCYVCPFNLESVIFGPMIYYYIFLIERRKTGFFFFWGRGFYLLPFSPRSIYFLPNCEIKSGGEVYLFWHRQLVRRVEYLPVSGGHLPLSVPSSPTTQQPSFPAAWHFPKRDVDDPERFIRKKGHCVAPYFTPFLFLPVVKIN